MPQPPAMPALPAFPEIEARAAARHGGPAALTARLLQPRTSEALCATPDHRFLAEAARAIFQAGFDWRAVDRRWPAFEDAFEGFDPARWTLMSDDDLDRLLRNTGLIRNAAKLRAVGANAVFFQAVAREHGSVGAWIAGWPPGRYMALTQALKARGSRLGGKTGQVFLRRMGVDSLILSGDVLAALSAAGVVHRMPTSARDVAAVQAALDQWMAESGHGLTRISQILALSIDADAGDGSDHDH